MTLPQNKLRANPVDLACDEEEEEEEEEPPLLLPDEEAAEPATMGLPAWSAILRP